jgi:hypothetical protein
VIENTLDLWSVKKSRRRRCGEQTHTPNVGDADVCVHAIQARSECKSGISYEVFGRLAEACRTCLLPCLGRKDVAKKPHRIAHRELLPGRHTAVAGMPSISLSSVIGRLRTRLRYWGTRTAASRHPASAAGSQLNPDLRAIVRQRTAPASRCQESHAATAPRIHRREPCRARCLIPPGTETGCPQRACGPH